jgi:hypothetical protein
LFALKGAGLAVNRVYIPNLACTILLAALLLSMPPATVHAGEARWHSFTALNGLGGNIVQAIWEDPQGRIWFGTEKGASRYDGASWLTYHSGDGLVDDNVWSISGDDQSVWFATSNGLSQLTRDGWRHFSTDDGLPNNDVRAVLIDRNSTVWAGTFGGGVARRTPGTARWENLDLSTVIAYHDIAVQAIWQAPDGALWFSTTAFGALRLDAGGKLVSFNFVEDSRNTVWAIGAGQADGSVWAATFRGVVQIAQDDQVAIPNASAGGLPVAETEILALASDQPGSIWFGTRASGVLHWASGNWERYTTADGLSRDYVLAILADRAGRIWFGTRGGGVTLLDPTPADQFARLRATIAARDIQHDAPIALDDPVLPFDQNNLQFTFTAPAAWRPGQEVTFRYWLSGASGQAPRLAHGDPASSATAVSAPNDFIDLPPGRYALHVVPNVDGVLGVESVYPFTIRSAPPALTIDALNVRVDDAALPRGVTLDATLFDTARQVQLSFAATDDAAPPDHIRYEYRVGDETAWRSTAGAGVTITLAQGAHRIDVRAIDADGNASPTATMTVIVPAPFWITLLLYLAIVVVPGTLGGALGVFWYRRWVRRQALLRAVRGQFIPYDVGPLIADPDRYIGRGPILDTILGRIDNNSFYVYGEPRIGKSSLLAQIRQRLEQRNAVMAGRYYLPVFRNIQDVPQEQFWLALIRGIGDSVPGLAAPLRTQQELAGYDDFDAQDDLETIVGDLAARVAPRQPLVVLLLDEVDTLQRYDPLIRQRFRAFCQHMQESLRVVLVGVPPPRAEAGETSPWYNIFAPIALEPLDLNDARFLIRSYNQNPYSYTPEAEQALIEAGDRKPFDTQWLCAESVRSTLAAGRAHVLLADVERAITSVVGERRRQYRMFWDGLPADLQANLCGALDSCGALAPERAARGDYDTLLVAGLALKRPDGYQLTSLFQRWLHEIAP